MLVIIEHFANVDVVRISFTQVVLPHSLFSIAISRQKSGSILHATLAVDLSAIHLDAI